MSHTKLIKYCSYLLLESLKSVKVSTLVLNYIAIGKQTYMYPNLKVLKIIHDFHHTYQIYMKELGLEKKSLPKRYMQLVIQIKSSRRSKNRYLVSLILVIIFIHLNHDSLGKKLFTLENKDSN